MSNEKAKDSNGIIEELRRISAADTAFTTEALNRILSACRDLLEEERPELSGCAEKRVRAIDSDCCKLLRDRKLLSKAEDYLVRSPEKECCCCVNDVYFNCMNTVRVICAGTRSQFSFSDFLQTSKLKMSADKCCLLLVLPIALKMELERYGRIHVSAARKGDRLEIVYDIDGTVPAVAELAAECERAGGSNGLFFTESLLALVLTRIADDCGALISVGRESISLLLPLADGAAEVNSVPDAYIDNRFSLPYIMLAGITGSQDNDDE